MTILTTRAGKGSPLTNNEMDANFTNLNTDKIETSEIGVSVQPYDATLLNAADIGVTVQAYDVDIPTIAASQAEMEAGSEVALRSMSPLRVAQAISALVHTSDVFPTGTAMLFAQAAAPTGWTKSTTHNDKALRVVSGATGGSAGGSVEFSTVFGRTASDASSLSIAQLAAHAHSISGADGAQGNYSGFRGSVSSVGYSGVTGSQGSGSTHSHGLDLRVQYVDVIICTKD